jgi:RNA polymerase sigma-70 factor, ECF subfamily
MLVQSSSYEVIAGSLARAAGTLKAESLKAESPKAESSDSKAESRKANLSEIKSPEAKRSAVKQSESGSSENEPTGAGGPKAEAFGRAYVTHRRSLLRYISGLTAGDAQRAEDVFHETMLRAWRHPDLLAQDESTLRPWLFAVARRIVIDGWRARSARPSEVLILDGVSETVPVARDEIEELVTRLEVRQALRHLTPQQFAAIVEVYYRQRSVAETARILGVPAGTIKSQLYYALKALRAALTQAERPSPQ